MRRNPHPYPHPRRFVFLGLREGVDAASVGSLQIEGRDAQIGSSHELERHRSPWRKERDVQRVIIGTNPSRADLILDGQDLLPEHLRLYISRDDRKTNDLRALEPDSVWINGQLAIDLDFSGLESGDEISLGPWLFRYEY